MSAWQEKWDGIHSKLETCFAECITAYKSDQKCKDSIEALNADAWSFKDWLINDPAAPVNSHDINHLLNSPGSFNIRACGDLETKQKHLRVDDPRRQKTELIWEADHDHQSGYPVIYSVTRRYRSAPGDIDHWEDAAELARRAVDEWRAYLVSKGLLSAR